MSALWITTSLGSLLRRAHVVKQDTSIRPSLHLWDARGLRPWLTLTFTVHIDLCSYGSPALFQSPVGAPTASGHGNKRGSMDTGTRPLQLITFHVISSSVPTFIHSPFSFSAIVVSLPRWALRPHVVRCLGAIVILGTWEIKSLLMSDDAPAFWNGPPFVMIQMCRVPSYGPQGCFGPAWLEQ